MRVFASCIAVALCAACGQATVPESTSSAPAPSTSVVFTVTPSNVLRARTTLPPDYELSALPPPTVLRPRPACRPDYEWPALPADATPTALWGIGQNWTSEPPDCAG